MTSDTWDVRVVVGRVVRVLHGGDKPALVLAQGENRIRVDLAPLKTIVAALVEGWADLASTMHRKEGETAWSEAQGQKGASPEEPTPGQRGEGAVALTRGALTLGSLQALSCSVARGIIWAEHRSSPLAKVKGESYGRSECGMSSLRA